MDPLELFFDRALDGFFFMMLDEPVRWDDSIDKERVLDYVFEHQRVTRANDAILAQYGVTREQFLGHTPAMFFEHDLTYGRRLWRELFDRGALVVETDERRADGTPIRIDGHYVCLYEDDGRIAGHFGIQRDVTSRVSNAYLQEELRTERAFGDIVGATPSMKKIFRAVEMVAATGTTVLVLGETGTGKELVARAIHGTSPRRDAVMVKVNCAAIPAALAESELFGHEKGAFTGAVQRKLGRFAVAHRGTIFLDEVGELPLDVQAKLLRVLQEQEFEAVGATSPTRVDVRVIAATNRNLFEAVQKGTFREDLFYRLNVFPIQVPPLRERKEDVPLLARHFLREYARRVGRTPPPIEEAATRALEGYHWPGNVRELANVLERAMILCDGPAIRAEHLGVLARSAPASGFLPLREIERQHIVRALEQTGGVLAGPRGAARLLGMRRSTVWSRMKKLGIEPTFRHGTDISAADRSNPQKS
ncbi:MAG: sigma-54 interaction domain-containing protein [Vicinamibacterales bacterium]